MRLVILCILLLGGANLLSYAITRDSSFVYNYGERLTLHPYLRSNFTALEVKNKNNLSSNSYRSNTPLSVGLGIWWRKFGLGLSIGIPHTELKEATPSQFLDFQYHYYGQYLVGDLYAFTYKGLYSRNEEGTVVFHPNSHITRVGVRASYPAMGENLSYAAAFEQSEQQAQTAFCFPVGLGFYYQNVLSTQPRIEVQQKNSYLCEIYGGVAFIVPWAKYYFAAGEGIFGLTQALNRESLVPFKPSYSFEVRTAIGYTRREWSLAFVLYYHALGFGQSETQRYFVSTTTAEIAYTYRIFRFYRPFRWVDWGNKLFGL